jgi:hypothetical protein
MSLPVINVAAAAPPTRDENNATSATAMAGLGRRAENFRFMESP